MLVNGTRAVTVNRVLLLERVKHNKVQHIAAYAEAMVGYRKAMIEELQKKLADAQEGRDVDHTFDTPRPFSHEKDYDRVISMLEWSVGETVLLDEREFAQYVEDDWQWKREFTTVNSNYRIG